jgi:hypothetical protein
VKERETVDLDTPAAWAISAIVAIGTSSFARPVLLKLWQSSQRLSDSDIVSATSQRVAATML